MQPLKNKLIERWRAYASHDPLGNFIRRTFRLNRDLLNEGISLVFGLFFFALTTRKFRLALLNPYSRETQLTPGFCRSRLAVLTFTRDVTQLNEASRREIFQNSWNGEKGNSWARAKFAETEALTSFNFERIRHSDTYYLLLNYLREFNRTAETKKNNTHLLEVGCSRGRLMSFFRDSKFVTAHGVDLNAEIIEEAKRDAEKYPHLIFHSGEALEYIRRLNHSFDLTYTSAVFMYLEYSDIRALLTKMAKSRLTQKFTIFETVSPDLNLDSDEKSRFEGLLRGQMCYSHNYKALLIESGFQPTLIQYAPVWESPSSGNSPVRSQTVALLIEGTLK